MGRIKNAKLWVPMVDGGWGWIVVVGSFLVHVFADGITYSFGIPLKHLMKEFGSDNATSSVIVSLLVGITLSVGPLASAVANKWGCRVTTIVGSIISTIGCIISLWANSVAFLMVSVGVIMGFGIGFMYCPAIIIVTVYFEKKRAMATGIAVCGAGVGTLVISPLANWAIEAYGWRGVFYLYGFILVLCALCGTTFRPLPFVKVEDEEEEKVDAKDGVGKLEFIGNTSPNGDAQEFESKALLDRQLRPYLSHSALNGDLSDKPTNDAKRANSLADIFTRPPVLESTGFLNIKDVFYTGSINALPNDNKEKFRSLTSLRDEKDGILTSGYSGEESAAEAEKMREIPKSLAKMLDLSLLTDSIFLIFAVSNFLTSIGFNAPLMYLPLHGGKLKFSDEKCSLVLSCFGAFNTVGRILFGIVSDHQLPTKYGKDVKRNRLWIYIISMCVCGVITCFVFAFTPYWSLMTYSALFGFTLSSYVCLTSVLLVDLVGLDRLTSAFGILLLFQGFATFIGPPAAGILADWTGEYNWTFAFCGVCLLVSGIMLFAIPRIQARRARDLESAKPRVVGGKSIGY